MIYKYNSFAGSVLAVLLMPVTVLYYLVVMIRHLSYDTGLFSSYRSKTFTVSVGNIAAGGTGKTPVVTAITEALKQNGRKTAVITRGYGRNSKGRVIVDKNTSAAVSGDEPLTIFNKTGSSVICDADRSGAVKEFESGYDAFVLDDAFQHRKIQKHLNIVLIDHDRFLGNRLLLPSGILRDPPSRLKKCDLIILTKIPDPENDSVQKKIGVLKRYGKPVVLSQIRYTKISNGTSEAPVEDLRNKRISAFCGIAEPEPFFKFFNGLDLVKKIRFKDHCRYGMEFESVLQEMKSGSDIIITTYKDHVKLTEDQIIRYNVWYLDIDLVFLDESLKIINTFDLIKGWIRAEK
ncbi:MAG: tetraacyldisaccharide 4'-kinase [Candidatus Delongbacteria bacterium]|jgi:tetraacyldisaccharide 4'-kinase|nr:tetraacyldisaccharide 4'-kinase [Candidatus Delongbacteria bacterium]MDY0018140.1 tetraacyldisaccharide 4'-kinase [Candidatus Delongbacteria bacterium]